MKRCWKASLLIVVAAAVLPLALAAGAAGKKARTTGPKAKVDVGAFLTKELMVMKMDGNETLIAIWAPFEFFTHVNGEDDVAQAEKDLRFLKAYQILMVKCETELEDGTEVSQSEDQLKARAVLKVEGAGEVKPLDKMPRNVAATVAGMKSAMEQNEGAGIQVLVFPSKTADGKPLIDTAARSKLTLLLKAAEGHKKSEIVWRTPFDAFNPVSACGKCGEQVSAKWSFCPWCGKKLGGTGSATE